MRTISEMQKFFSDAFLPIAKQYIDINTFLLLSMIGHNHRGVGDSLYLGDVFLMGEN